MISLNFTCNYSSDEDVLSCENVENLTNLKDTLKNTTKTLILKNGLSLHLHQLEQYTPFQSMKFLTIKNYSDITLESEVFSNYLALEAISITSSNLTTLPNKSFSGHKLSNLDLSKNEIVDISENSFHELDQLQILDLSNNKLTKLPSNIFKSTRNLEKVYLNANNLEQLQKGWTNGLENLIELSISDNKLSMLESDQFNKLKNIRRLYVNNNEIELVSGKLTLNSLTILKLGGNKLKLISIDTFTKLPSLIQISIDSNKLESVDERAFENNLALKYINLFGNPIKCPSLKFKGREPYILC